MKHLIFALLPFIAQADLVITEVMSSSNHSNSTIDGDWWELTNNGTTAVNLSGYRWDDESNIPSTHVFPSYSLPAGASCIMLDEATTASITPFRNAWGIPASVKIFVASDFGGFAGFSGGNGDTLYLYNAFNVVVDSFSFGAATGGQSFAFFVDGSPVPGGLSIDGEFGAKKSSQAPADTGSPGSAPPLPSPLPPVFIAPFKTYWPANRNLSTSEFRITAQDPNPADTITISTISKPAWLTITDLGGGKAQLSGTPTDAEVGTHTFQVQAADNSGATTPSTQTYTIQVLPATSPIILNEYNAVGPDKFLNNDIEGAMGAATDSFFGQVAGNGGQWIELVVLGIPGEGPTFDIRGGRIEIVSADSTRIIKLSENIALSEIPVGTILTLSDTQPSELNMNSQLTSNGTIWSNIWMYDPILIDQSASTHPAIPAIGSSDTTISIFAPDGTHVYGPSGESVGASDSNANGIPDDLININDTEVYRLEQNPSATVDPLFGLYDDGSSSSFGSPNVWSNNTMTQSFASFIQSNSPPTFGTLPSHFAVRGQYNETITSIDPQAQGVTISALTLPSFLTFTDGGTGSASIVNNRPLTTSDMGTYEIVIVANDGQPTLNRSYYAYQLTVVNPAPAVLLNEYNAVSDTKFLNGGTAFADEDGAPNAADAHFGRVTGNGGDWFELVVVGDGTTGTTDLRGWTIEIGQVGDSKVLVPRTTISLTADSRWAAVRNGTILTFIAKNTAAGGLNTDILRQDRFDTDGWGWSNIYLGDGSLVTGVTLANIEIDSNNTQFRILDNTGFVVFGPVGEGVIPSINVGSTEIFELEGDPRPTIAFTDNASGTDQQGYDDSSSASTFGAPNVFTPPFGGTTTRPQDFTPYIFIPSTYANWATGFGIGAQAQTDDNDNDGWNNLEEYLFGGDPTLGSSQPGNIIDSTEGSVSFNVRSDDPTYSFMGQRSGDLINWVTEGLTETTGPSALGASFNQLKLTFDGEADRQFFRVIPQ
ncbi:MAG: lamin tail domain-containing protein [Verrucomicrobiaceae bacterium]